MPPSGYIASQARAIGGFLQSCSEELRAEAHTKGVTIAENLQQELCSIEQYVSHARLTGVQRAVLDLTYQFYRSIAEHPCTDEAQYKQAVESVLGMSLSDILGIKI